MDTVHGLDVYAELWPRLSLHGSIFGDDKRGTCATSVYLSVCLSLAPLLLHLLHVHPSVCHSVLTCMFQWRGKGCVYL